MTDVLGSFYTGRKIRQGVSASSPSNETGVTPEPLNPPGSPGVNLFTNLGDVLDNDYNGKNGFVPVVVDEGYLELQPLPQFEEYRLISGGVVQWTGIGYIFNISSAIYKIGGVLYQTVPTTKTLATPDPTNNRIDVLAVDVNGQVVVIAGTPSPTPVKPQIDPVTQLELTSVLVIAASTTPTLTAEVIYDENVEWVGSTTGTGTVAFNSTVDPFQGSLSINTTNIQNGLKVRLTRASDYNISGVQTIGFQIKLKAQLFAGQNIGMTFLNSSGNPISNQLILNLNKTNLNYQFVGIALNSVTFTSNLIRSVEFNYILTKGATVHLGYFLDIIKLEGGINPPVTVNSFLNLSDTPSSYAGQGGKTVAVKADASGLEFVAVQDDFTVSTGNILFDRPRKYGFTTALTGNITFAITDAKESSMAKILHNSATAPTFSGPGGVTIRKEGGTYTVSVANIIYCLCHKNDAGTVTLISYTITRAL